MNTVYVVNDYDNCQCLAIFKDECDAEEYLLALAQEFQYELYYLVYDIEDYSLTACVTHCDIHKITIA